MLSAKGMCHRILKIDILSILLRKSTTKQGLVLQRHLMLSLGRCVGHAAMYLY